MSTATKGRRFEHAVLILVTAMAKAYFIPELVGLECKNPAEGTCTYLGDGDRGCYGYF